MKQGKKEILSSFKENWKHYMCEFKNCFNDLKHKETVYRQIPNLLTASRAIGIIPVNVLFLTGNVIPGMILLTMLLSTDFFDGRIARRYGIVSKFGADLDAVCDKIMAVGLMIPLLFSNFLIFINLFLECIISIVNVKGRLNGVDTKTLFSGKVKTCLLFTTLCLGYLSMIINSFHAVFLCTSVLTLPAQIKTLIDYKKFVSKETKKCIEKEDKLVEIKPELSLREQKIKDLEREKEFLLSCSDKEREDVKIRKRKK